jgi:peptidoglycan/xylan/chitin deacetylase (PgdA/CDA1 family)
MLGPGKEKHMVRTDRALTIYLFHRVLRRLQRHSTPRVPVLMYHSISDEQRQGHPYYETATSARVFAAQMEFLYRSGYSTLSLAEAVTYLKSDHPVAGKYVVITFDDGYRDFRTNAFPVLRKYCFRATMFVPTAFIDGTPRRFKDKDCLTWSDIRELQREGVDFGSHTVSHPQLRHLTQRQIAYELRASKTEIEDVVGLPVQSFSYPYAFPEGDRLFVRRLRDTLQECGYKEGVSTIIGTAKREDDELFLKRLPVNAWDDLAFLEAKLEGSYDWLRMVQYASKFMRSAGRQ